jgi:hypothetical protein
MQVAVRGNAIRAPANEQGRTPMFCRPLLAAAAFAVAAITSATAARAFDDAKYPDLSGQWLAVGVGDQPAFDPTKPPGLRQQAPLTPEYQAVLEASVADQARGGFGNWPSRVECLPPGMPAMMSLYRPMEIIVLPETTYIRIEYAHDTHRRIFTDGRDWPADIEPSFAGYSIGKWIDTDGDGRYDLLEVETRSFKGPRALDAAGTPLHEDNQSIVRERIFFDRADPKLLHDEITLVDHALTRPWTVLKTYRRDPARYPSWSEDTCHADNKLMKIGTEVYSKGDDGSISPTRKGQPGPDLRYFPKKPN